MNKLLKAEFFKLRRSLGFKIPVFIAIGVSVFIFALFALLTSVSVTTDEYGNIVDSAASFTGYYAFYTALSQSQTIIILVGVLSAVFICNEFGARTFGHSLFSGYTRRKLMSAKLIALGVGVVILASILPAIMTLGGTIIDGFGGTFKNEGLSVLRDYGLYLLGALTYASFAAFLGYVIRNVGGTLGAAVGFGVFWNLLVTVVSVLALDFETAKTIQDILQYFFISQFTLLGTGSLLVGPGEIDILRFILVEVIWLGAFVAGSALLFEKADLK